MYLALLIKVDMNLALLIKAQFSLLSSDISLVYYTLFLLFPAVKHLSLLYFSPQKKDSPCGLSSLINYYLLLFSFFSCLYFP